MTIIGVQQHFSKMKAPLISVVPENQGRRIRAAISIGTILLSLATISTLVQVVASAQLDKKDYMVDANHQASSTTPRSESSTAETTKAVAAESTSKLQIDNDNDSQATTAAIGQDDLSITTLLVDYDQQGYSLSASSQSTTITTTPTTSTTSTTSGSESNANTASPSAGIKAASPAVTPSTAEAEIRKSRATDIDTFEETIGQSDVPQSAKLVRADGSPPKVVVSEVVTATRDSGRQLLKLQDKDKQINKFASSTLQRPSSASSYSQQSARQTQVFKERTTTDEPDLQEILLKKKPYSKYWTVEQKWDDIFKRVMGAQDALKRILLKSLIREIENFSDVALSRECSDDLKYIQEYQKTSTNFRWLVHMGDATGKSEPGMLTGNLADLGHVVQCIKVRAPPRPSNHSFDERYFEVQTETLGERFRGKYCLASLRPVLPERPHLVSRFNELMNESLLSNISYFGEPSSSIKARVHQLVAPKFNRNKIDKRRLDQVPFESEFYQYLISQRNFMYSLPRFVGVCYPSSCNRDDVRRSVQKLVEDHHQVVDVEFECEQEEVKASSWFTFSRSIVYVFLTTVATVSIGASLARYIMLEKLGLKKRRLNSEGSTLNAVFDTLDLLSMDKCAGILFVKTREASPFVDRTKLENNRSTSIDALKGFLMLMTIYSQLIYLGCLPVPFMWSKWGVAMFPFYRAYYTQIFLNMSIWSEAFYMISAYLIGAKLLENNRPSLYDHDGRIRQPNLSAYIIKRYVRLVLPMVAFITLNYVWPRLSNGYVMQDQASKLMKPCDNHGWTNMLMFHNHHTLNETCLWPSHVSASFFQLHLISYPILLLLLFSLRTRLDAMGTRKIVHVLTKYSGLMILFALAVFGIVYPAIQASDQRLIVPFLIDYIDFDNYKRVIEWTVTPTHNHLTSYMVGLALAYLMVKRRADKECQHRGSFRDSQCIYLHKGSSFESVVSSVSQEFDGYATKQQTFTDPMKFDKVKHLEASGQTKLPLNVHQLNDSSDADGLVARVISALNSGLVCFLMLISITSSWFWTGFGAPMSSSQTFWYICGTKFVFIITFAYLFYKHFATRRNATNPWMITRFLVPIGRMSLTIFYLSWLVIWFDLLSSLYQWHPSHYFVFEKFNEIIFMVLVIGMFVYGSFEGTVKIISYKNRALQLAAQLKKEQQAGLDTESHGFETLFVPVDEDQDGDINATLGKLTNGSSPSGKMLDNRFLEKSSTVQYQTGCDGSKSVSKRDENSQQLQGGYGSKNYATPSTKDGKPTNGGGRHLSIADQYKLNAELRANYSFASIGLYEQAGATDYLPDHSDPQMSSPSTSDK